MAELSKNTETQMFEEMIKQALINKVKDYLYESIENDIEQLAKESVKKFLELEISKDYEASTMRNNIYFNFVNKIKLSLWPATC